jgi:predicted dehydrogenase
MIRIGIVGIGYLGRIHVSVLQELAAQFEIVGIYDHKPIDGLETSAALQALPFFETYQALIGAVDAIAIIASTPAHFHLAKEALLAGKAVFIEKPMCATLKEAQELHELALQQQSFVQVGHVERFNPVLAAASSYSTSHKLLAFDSCRTASFQQRGSEVSVVLDLMIHDLDLLLAHVSSKVVAIDVLAKSEQSPFSDEVEANITFEDGLKAKLFASRISDQRQRTLRLQMPEHNLALDLLEKTAYVQLNSGSEIEALEVEPSNALQTQWLDFASAYQAGHAPRVGAEAGLRALELALEIDARAQVQIAQNSKHFIQ